MRRWLYSEDAGRQQVQMGEAAAARLELLADPNAVRQARAWLTDQLEDWSSEGIATVQLLVSELVTNAILHTDDVVEVTAERAGSGVTVEVADRNPSKPVIKRYERDAATGRGLHLVEALADAWGVRGDDGRKAVWFRVIDGASRRPVGPGTVDLADWHDLEPWPSSDGRPGAAAAGASTDQHVTVCLSELPVAVYLAAEEHHDALMRELGLVLRSSGETANPKVPARLLELAASVVEQFGLGNEQRRVQVEAARRAGQHTVDVVMMFPASAAEAVRATADQLEEVDGYGERGQLLTPPSTPTVKRFRRWYTDEIVRQLQGLAPRPWSDPEAA